MNLWSVIGPALPERAAKLARIFPLEFIHLSRFAVLLIGFALVIVSLNLYRRKKRALQFAVVISALSIVFHLTKGLDYEEAVFSGALLVLLFVARSRFTVESSVPNLRRGLLLLTAALATAMLYGIAGFWLLDKREFGINFTLGDAVHRTLLFLSLLGDPDVVPRTRYAHWFVDSLYLITAVAIAYALFALFRPVVYRYRTLPHERALAQEITAQHGRSALDYFKYWTDKSFFFSTRRNCFLAYRVGGGYAMVLGDPVGPEQDMEPAIRRFEQFCDDNDWRVAFHQTLPDFLPLYKTLGYRKLKIGDDAIVDLKAFSLQGKEARNFRNRNNKFEKEGIRFANWEPPVPDSVLAQLRQVSDAWLEIPGRRERTFSLGLFDPAYLRQTPAYAVMDHNGKMLAFVNQIPSFAKGEATIDLMRHRDDAPSGIMDYLFTKLLLALKQKGYTRFNMGMAPMAGFQEHEQASPEERAVHYFMQRMNFLFSYQGLRHYKAKFATFWEPRYLIYKNALSLPRVANAISEVSEIHG